MQERKPGKEIVVAKSKPTLFFVSRSVHRSPMLDSGVHAALGRHNCDCWHPPFCIFLQNESMVHHCKDDPSLSPKRTRKGEQIKDSNGIAKQMKAGRNSLHEPKTHAKDKATSDTLKSRLREASGGVERTPRWKIRSLFSKEMLKISLCPGADPTRDVCFRELSADWTESPEELARHTAWKKKRFKTCRSQSSSNADRRGKQIKGKTHQKAKGKCCTMSTVVLHLLHMMWVNSPAHRTHKKPLGPSISKCSCSFCNREAKVCTQEVGTYLHAMLVDDSLSVLSLARWCDELGSSNSRKPGANPDSKERRWMNVAQKIVYSTWRKQSNWPLHVWKTVPEDEVEETLVEWLEPFSQGMVNADAAVGPKSPSIQTAAAGQPSSLPTRESFTRTKESQRFPTKKITTEEVRVTKTARAPEAKTDLQPHAEN